MNILVLMAGESEAFRDAGHVYPKNLIEVAGRTLIEHVLDPLRKLVRPGGRLFCLVLESELRRFYTGNIIRLITPEAQVIAVPGATAGAACTALLAMEFIDNDVELLLVNGDQIILEDLGPVLEGFRASDGGVVVFDAVHPRWSYVRCDAAGHVVEAAEKRPISRLATAGFYYFRHGSTYVRGAMDMIRKDVQTDGKFFVCPVFNEMILRNLKVRTFEIERRSYVSLATPQNVSIYEESLDSRPNESRYPAWR